MLGLVQERPLLCHTVIDHAAIQHAHRRIVSHSDNSRCETSYSELRNRALRLAQRLAREGIHTGDRVATLASSTARHMEVWYGTTGIGAIYHPVNPRFSLE